MASSEKPLDPESEPPAKWAGAPRKKHEIASADTAVFTLAASEGSGGGENVYTIGPGTMLAGKYKVIRIIGKGGMGLVVEARHVHLDTRVAMKFLLPEYMSYTEASGRFLREARAASRLQSHHVARVLDVGTLEAGEPYMVMEYLAGEDLAYHAHAQTPLTIGDSIEYITQACDAIAEAHQLGIVHRDLKPANLFLSRRSDGRPMVKVLDFGISKVVGEGVADMALTQTTTILGSALYMSPEQMQSARNVDHRTDVYALGVCLFELLGREQPYFAESFPELCAKVFTSPPKSLRSLRPEVPEGLERAIEKALAREPDKRYQSIAELVQGISPYARLDTRSRMEGLLRQHAPLLRLFPPAPMPVTTAVARSREPPPRPVAAPRHRSQWPFFVAFAVCGGLAAIGWQALGPRTPNAPALAPEPAATPPVPTPSAEEAPPASAAVLPASTNDAPGRDTRPSGEASVETSAAASAAPSATASARAATPAATARPETPAPERRPRERPATDAPPERPSPPPAHASPGPGINPDLVQETCKMKLPDGTEKIVPCP